MNYYQIKFIKGGKESEKEYTYSFPEELEKGTLIDLPHGHGVIVSRTTKERIEELGADNIKKIAGITEVKDG